MVFNARPRCSDGSGGTLPWCDFISIAIGIMNVSFIVLIIICFLSLKGLCKSCSFVQKGLASLSLVHQNEDQDGVRSQQAIEERAFEDSQCKVNIENPLRVRSVELAEIHPRVGM